MLRFKQFIQLQEALNIEQKHYLGISHMGSSFEAQKLSKHMIPENQDSIRIPLTNNTKEKVKDHLEKHGYTMSDYTKGEAIDKHGRKTTIGSVLKDKKTQAPDDLVKGFENDDRNSKISNKTHDILFSRNSEHIGECSTRKGWKSCAALTPSGKPTGYGKGAAARKLGASIRAGSHVAYLMKHGEDDVEKADARILLHPYHSYDEAGNIKHSVLMPERKVYSKKGGKFSDFHTSLEDYARKNNPMKSGDIYHKDRDVYDDDNQTIRFDTSPHSVKSILLNKNVGIRAKEDAIKSTKLPHQTISSVLNEPTTDGNRDDLNRAHSLIAEHQKLSNDHFDKLLRNHVTRLASNKNLTNAQIKKIAAYKPEPVKSNKPALDDEVNRFRHAEVNRAHDNLIETHSDKLKSDDIHHILDHNIEHEDFMKSHEIKTSRDGSSPIHSIALHLKSKLTPEHIEKIKKSMHTSAPGITGENYTEFLGRHILGINKNDSDKEAHNKISKGLDHEESETRAIAAEHPRATPKHIDKALDDSSDYVKSAAMRNPNASPDNISKALDSENTGTKRIAARHPNNNEDTIHKALDNKNEFVRQNSLDHHNATPKNIDKGLNDPEDFVRTAAIENHNANNANISKALKDHNRTVRLKAINHPNVTTEHAKFATQDPDSGIAAKAQKILDSQNQ